MVTDHLSAARGLRLESSRVRHFVVEHLVHAEFVVKGGDCKEIEGGGEREKDVVSNEFSLVLAKSPYPNSGTR